MPAANATPSKTTWIMTSQKTKLVNKKQPVKIKPGRFGLFHCVDDNGIGRRVFNIHCFDAMNSGKILVELKNGHLKVSFIEEGAKN